MDRLQARPPANVLNPRCPSQRVLDMIADKWSVLALRALRIDGTLRYGELHRRIDGISQKMLTQTLRELERNGFVKRTVFPVVPPQVEYALTPLGMDLHAAIDVLCRWAQEHMDDVMQARRRYEEEDRTQA